MNQRNSSLPVVITILAAYGLLLSLFIAARGLAHSYAHWVEGVSLADMPALTTLALPFIGLDGKLAWLSSVVWIVLALWPGFAWFQYWRSDSETAASTLNHLLLAWLMLLLTLAIWLIIGLFLPFSLL